MGARDEGIQITGRVWGISKCENNAKKGKLLKNIKFHGIGEWAGGRVGGWVGG